MHFLGGKRGKINATAKARGKKQQQSLSRFAPER
jgi:hypothetical protein